MNYLIDYNELQQNFFEKMKNKVFQSEKMAKEYVTKWIDFLQEAEESSYLQLRQSDSIVNKRFTHYKISYQDVKFGPQTLRIHFNGEFIASCWRKLTPKPNEYKASYTHFSEEGLAPILFSSEGKDNVSTGNQGPILVVPFKKSLSGCLVIHGDREVEEAKQDKRDVKIILLDVSEDPICSVLFPTLFDEMVFKLYKDSHNILHHRKQIPLISDQELMNHSFLTTEKIDFSL